ncbi:MAG: hypothetical protein GXX96_30455 [Planctomycetaceae bacterium]|nr:hypothetical protein [Planctomycetaceae bacterium]
MQSGDPCVGREQPNYVFCQRPRCPSCGSARLQTYRSVADGEVTTRHTLCKDCGEKFRVVLE